MIRVPLRLASEAWRQLEPRHRIAACAIAGGMTVAAALESVSIGLVFPLIALLAGSAPPDFLAAVSAFAGTAMPSARALVLAILGILLLKSGIVVAVTSAQAAFLASVARLFGDRALAAHLTAPFEQHLKRSGADMTASVVGRLYTVLVFLYEPVFIIVSETLVAIAIVAVLLAIEPLYSVLLLIAFAALGLLGNMTLRRYAQRAGDAKEAQHRQLLHAYGQTLSAIAEIHASNRTAHFLKLIRRHIDSYARAVGAERFILFMPRTFMEAGVAILLFGGLAVALARTASDGELVGLMALFAAAAVRLTPSASRILFAATMLDLARDAFSRLLPDLAPVVTGTAPRQGGREGFAERLALNGVSYSYPSAARPALDEVSLRVAAGERVMVSGRSGSGKTTLLMLLVGLLKPQSGAIMIDSEDIGNDPGRLREIVGFVPQDPVLLDDTLRANIVFGWDEGDYGRLRRAVGLSHLDAVVAALPAGLETKVGGNGVRLSRGQLQRVAIARALYRDPKILLMDEPTASLDAATEADIADTLDKLDDDVTVIIVSHRAAAMRRCDREVEMEGGRIVADKAGQRSADAERPVIGASAKNGGYCR